MSRRPQGPDLYRLLGVKPTATSGDIADRFADLAEPDDGIQDAYEILRHPTRRRSYDDTRRARSEAARDATSSDHEAIAGDQDISLELSFDQAALGTTATVHLATPTPCSACSGSGAIGGAVCTDCSGAGFHTRTSSGINIRTECRTCDGAGRATPKPCEACAGQGVIDAIRAVTIRVPAGVVDGARLRFSVPGPGGATGSTQRHALVRVATHPYFTRRGTDLELRVPITIAEAALGATVTIPTLTGAVAIRVPPGTSTGRTLRVRGHGIPTSSAPGDLLATVEVVIPTELDDDQRRALEAFAAATPSPREHFARPSPPSSGATDAAGHP